MSEWEGGYIMKECPFCGQYCKLPDEYIASHDTGAYAISYCMRCNKEVRLSVVFV